MKKKRTGSSKTKRDRGAAQGESPRMGAAHDLHEIDFTTNFPGSLFQLVREQDGTVHMPFVRSSLGQPAGLSSEQRKAAAANPMASLHADDVPLALRALEASAKTLEPYRLELRARPAGADPRAVKWVQVSATPHQLADGRVAWNGVVMDVTDLKRAEQELKESKRQLDTLMSNLPGLVYRCRNDRDWTMEFISDGCRELTGYNPDEIVGSQTLAYNDLIHPDDREWVWRDVQVALSGRRPYRLEYRIRTKDGEEKWVWEQGRGVFAENGEVLALEGIVSDNTEKRRLEDEINKAQRLEVIGILAGGIAHDFNNALMGVVGSLSLAKHILNAESPVRLHLDNAEKAASQAAYLTHQLLTFARGGLPVRDIVGLKSVIMEAAGFALRGARVRPAMQIPDDLWCAYVDRGQIIQVVQNLVINANQAMPKGGTLTISAANVRFKEGDNGRPPRLEPGDYVRIAVKDEGEGIAPEHLPHIFEPFFTTKAEGTGLGLTTSRSIVERHGGSLTVHSVVKQGSVFEVYLPARRHESEHHPAPHAGTPISGFGRRVLVMDDDPTVRAVLYQMLDRLGYGVELAAGIAEAVAKCERELLAGHRFDVALLDLTVPGEESGALAVARLRRIDPTIKAVVASGYSRDPVMAEYAKYGFQGVLTKPFQIEQLGEVLAQALSGEQQLPAA